MGLRNPSSLQLLQWLTVLIVLWKWGDVRASVSWHSLLCVLAELGEWFRVLNASRGVDAYSKKSNRDRAVWYLVESSRRSGEPSRSDRKSSLASGEMGSSAIVRVGAWLMVAELPSCIDRRGLISTLGLDWSGWYFGVSYLG